MSIQFEEWPKTPRLFRQTWITEKIDGTNAAVIIEPLQSVLPNGGIFSSTEGAIEYATIYGPPAKYVAVNGSTFAVAAQSRKRLITPDDDNAGFARWVYDNASALVLSLGVGRHFGEWWGSGIQRGYGLKNGEKRFSLFNTRRWWFNFPEHTAPEGLEVVPVLHIGEFDTAVVRDRLEKLRETGSYAEPGFRRPEGVVVFHEPSRQVFKALLEDDDVSKTEAAARG